MVVYLVQHERTLSDGREDVTVIGVFSSYRLAEEAVETARQVPGSQETGSIFHIDSYPLDEDHWCTGYVTL